MKTQPCTTKNKQNNRFQVFVKLDKTHTFWVNSFDTCQSFKEVVAQKFKINPEQFRLIYSGHDISSINHTLQNCGISRDTTIHMIGRLVGR